MIDLLIKLAEKLLDLLQHRRGAPEERFDKYIKPLLSGGSVTGPRARYCDRSTWVPNNGCHGFELRQHAYFGYIFN